MGLIKIDVVYVWTHIQHLNLNEKLGQEYRTILNKCEDLRLKTLFIWSIYLKALYYYNYYYCDKDINGIFILNVQQYTNYTVIQIN